MILNSIKKIANNKKATNLYTEEELQLAITAERNLCERIANYYAKRSISNGGQDTGYVIARMIRRLGEGDIRDKVIKITESRFQ